MSRFSQFLKEQLEGNDVQPDYSDSAKLSNVSNNIMSDEREENKLSEFIKKNDIRIPKEAVETIIALVDKSLDDWNREKKLDGEEIAKIVKLAIEDNIISVKSY